jgi:hypothetical protein
VRRPPEEQEAWRAYRAELHRFVRARVEDEAAAEDLVHDVLLRAYSQRDTLRDASQLRPVQRARKMLAAMLLDCCRVELDSRGGIMDYEPRGRCGGCKISP